MSDVPHWREMGVAVETKKAVGQRGSWFVKVDGVELPCMHKHWLKGLDYHDPFKRHSDESSNTKFEQVAKATKMLGKIVLSDDNATLDQNGDILSFERTKYIAVYAVSGVSYSREDGLRFKVTQRLANLK